MHRLSFITILVISIVFSVLYAVYLFYRVRSGRNLIIEKSYLGQLLLQFTSFEEAAKGENHEISIETVEFTKSDFDIKSFLTLIKKSICDGGVEKNDGN